MSRENTAVGMKYKKTKKKKRKNDGRKKMTIKVQINSLSHRLKKESLWKRKKKEWMGSEMRHEKGKKMKQKKFAIKETKKTIGCRS